MDIDTITDNQHQKKTVLETHGIKIGKAIGSGTYAKVKVAYSDQFKTQVAVKIMSKSKAPKEYLKKFLPRELDVIRRLKHQNLIRFYQSIETTHRVYLIMQYAENGSLLDLIRKHGHLTEDVARKYFRQLISAVEYCHGIGIVHRDIKCENILFDKNMDLKIIDFGFARENMNKNKPILSETYCGSYAYASPEVLKGIPYDPRYSDCWATGVVLYSMVFGRLPFDGSNYHELLRQVQSKITFPKKPSVSDSCKNLIQKILCPLKYRLSINGIQNEPWFNEPITCGDISPNYRVSQKIKDQAKAMANAAVTFIKNLGDKTSPQIETPTMNDPSSHSIPSGYSPSNIVAGEDLETEKLDPANTKNASVADKLSTTKIESIPVKIFSGTQEIKQQQRDSNEIDLVEKPKATIVQEPII